MSDKPDSGSESQDLSAGGEESTEQQRKDQVNYETHRRLLDEKKKVQRERDELLAEKEARSRKELEEKGEVQKLLELERKKAEEASAKLRDYEEKFTEAKKLSSLLKALDNGVDEKFFGFLPIEKIKVDEESGEINLSSVAEVAEMFKKTYPELLKSKQSPQLPLHAPQSNGLATISESEWKKLKSADMKKWKHSQIIWEK